MFKVLRLSLDYIKLFLSSDIKPWAAESLASLVLWKMTVTLPSDYETCVRTVRAAATFQEDEKQPGAKFIFGVTFLHPCEPSAQHWQRRKHIISIWRIYKKLCWNDSNIQVPFALNSFIKQVFKKDYSQETKTNQIYNKDFICILYFIIVLCLILDLF